MSLLIKISRLSNFLFFIQKTNQCQSVRFDLQKYLSDENFNLSFYGESENKIWEQIKKLIGKQNIGQFQKIAVSLKPVFVSHWRKESKRLLLWKKYFQSNQLLFQRVISDIKNLSGIKHFKVYKTPIYLISDPAHHDKEVHAWFSWRPEKSFIVVEIPHGLKALNTLFPVSILTHEFFHLILRENKNLFSKIVRISEENKKLLMLISNGMPHKTFLEELLISSFIPEGYLGKKYFNTKIIARVIKQNSLLMWRRFIANKLNQRAKEYVEGARQIDKEYLKNLIKVTIQKAK